MTRWTSIWANSNGHQFEQTLGDSEGQGSLVCCSPWDCQRVGHDSDWTTTVKKCGVNCVFSFYSTYRPQREVIIFLSLLIYKTTLIILQISGN